MANTVVIPLVGIVLVFWLARSIQRYRHERHRLVSARAENDNRSFSPAPESTQASGSQQSGLSSDEPEPITLGPNDDRKSKPAGVRRRATTSSIMAQRRTVPSAAPTAQSASSSAAMWDEDDLDFIETRAAEHHAWRTGVAPLAAFDDNAVDSNQSESERARPAHDAHAEKPHQTDFFDDASSDDRPALDDSTARDKSHRTPDRRSRGRSVTRKDVTDQENTEAIPARDLLPNGPTTPNKGAPATPTPSANSPESPYAETASDIPVRGGTDYDEILPPTAPAADDFTELFADDDLCALDDEECAPEDETDLLDALPDAQLLVETQDEPESSLYEVDSDGDRLDEYQKARRLAAQTIRKTDGDADALWPVLLDIFQASPWPATRRSIEHLLHAGTPTQALTLATEIRRIWIDHSEFGQSFDSRNTRGERWQYSREALSQLSWPRAAKLADCWSSYPDAAEVEHFLEDLFERWHTSNTAIRAFPSFHLYLGYATGELNGTLQDWREWSFEVDEALQDPFERAESWDEWSSARTVLAELGIERPITHKPFGREIEMPDY